MHHWYQADTVASMLTFGQRVPGTALPPPAPVWAGVGTCTLPETAFAEPGPEPSRLTHHLLALTTAGHGSVEVDFQAHAVRPGTLIWIRPGQVVRFGGQAGLDATLITWERDLLGADHTAAPGVDDPAGPARWQLGGEDQDAIISEFAQLAVDCSRHGPAAAAYGGPAAALLRHELTVLLLRIALLTAGDPGGPGGAESRTFARFRRALEEGHPHSRRVEDYAARLGCSVRTLTRASLAVTGRTAKQVVDDRVALEARRLLACTPMSVAEVGRRLGFGEPTNFGRFFHREVGVSPGVFRTANGGPATADDHAEVAHIPSQRPPAD